MREKILAGGFNRREEDKVVVIKTRLVLEPTERRRQFVALFSTT